MAQPEPSALVSIFVVDVAFVTLFEPLPSVSDVVPSVVSLPRPLLTHLEDLLCRFEKVSPAQFPWHLSYPLAPKAVQICGHGGILISDHLHFFVVVARMKI